MCKNHEIRSFCLDYLRGYLSDSSIPNILSFMVYILIHTDFMVLDFITVDCGAVIYIRSYKQLQLY